MLPALCPTCHRVVVHPFALVQDALGDRLVDGKVRVRLGVDDGLDGIGARLLVRLDGDEADVASLLLSSLRRRELHLPATRAESANRLGLVAIFLKTHPSPPCEFGAGGPRRAAHPGRS